MPKGSIIHTTPSVPIHISPALSITALGEQAASDQRLAKRVCPCDDDLACTLNDREGALNSLIAALPATTLGDAVHQLAGGYNFAGILEACDVTLPQSRAYMEHTIRDLHRVMLSVLPVVAKAAGMTLDDLALGYVAAFRGNHFAGKGPGQ